MKALALSLSLFILSAPATFSQEHPSVNAQANTVFVGADGKFESAPDTAQLQFTVSVQDETSQVAYQKTSKNVDQVRQVLRANGVDPKQATVGFFSVQPVYDWKPKQHLVGYRVTTDITLKLKDFSKIGALTQQLAEANVSETQTLSYVLENIDEAKNRAVEDAYRRARNSAETIAHASGRGLGELSYASGRYIRERSHADAADGSRDGGRGECGACSHRGIYSTECQRHRSRQCLVQLEVS